MADESIGRPLPPSRRNNGTRVPRGLDRDRFSTFGIVVRAIWPIKPALNLAQRAGCTERAANFYITGAREPSFDVLMVVLHEMRPRKRA